MTMSDVTLSPTDDVLAGLERECFTL